MTTFLLATTANTSAVAKGTQRQFSDNICSEDDLRSRIFGTLVVKFLACLPLLGFSNILKMVNCPFLTDFYPKKVTKNFLEPFFWMKFSKRFSLIPIIFGSLDFQLGNPNR